jgi:LAS superfamily LD-carboxypeptidase LdcB
VSLEEIARGDADDVVDLVLQTSSIPGYSKHHTGYAMDWADLTSGKGFTDFVETPAHRWLAKDNYHNAKRFGFIPSYPPGASQQGPDPETWEYVWVGVERLKESW